MKQTKFEGRASEMKKDSPWLASEDLEGLGDQILEIEGIYRNEDVVMDKGKRENNFSLKFKGTNKQLIINKANRETLKDLYTNKTKEWIGKKVIVYVDDHVKQVTGGFGPGLRIRKKKP